MISICTTTANANGAVLLDSEPMTDPETRTARVSRTKTLDGGCVIIHSGVADGDRTLDISAVMSDSEATKLKEIFETESVVLIGWDFVYSGVIESFRYGDSEVNMKLLLKEKI